MKHTLMVLFLSLLLPLFAGAQPPAADSLRHLLRADTRPNVLRVQRLLALGQELKNSDAPQATQVNEEALRLARQLAYPPGEGLALLALSNLHRRQNDFEAAHRDARQAQRLYVDRHDVLGQGRAWLQLSTVYMLQEKPAASLAAALKGLPMAERAGDQVTTERLRYIMGNVYHTMGNYTEALPLLRGALKMGQRNGDDQLVLSTLGDIGNCYKRLKRWPQALLYFQRALQLSQRVGDHQGEAGFETNLAELYGLQGNQPEALAHSLRARQLVRTNQDEYNLPLMELVLARAYLLSNQTDSVLELAHHALQLSQQTKSNGNIRTAADLLAQAYAQQQNFEQAYHFRNLQLAYNDTLSGEDTQLSTNALRYGYELDRKKAQIALLSKTRQLQAQTAERQRQQLYALLAGLAGVVLLAGLLLRNIFLKQRINHHLNETNHQIAAHRDDLDQALRELRATQAQLVQHEKLASLGQLTAGVAHEIQNPLNFITNFSDLGVELTTELQEELAKESLSVAGRVTIEELLHDLAQNQLSIHQHGRRADRIVKSMLEHSRVSSGQPQLTDLNALCEECLRLAYYSWQATNKDFKATLNTQFASPLPSLQVVPQDLTRVLVNLLTNAFYAVSEKRRLLGSGYEPQVSIQTEQTDDTVCIRVRDNGNGIPTDVRQRIFEPFFTTKPTGEGTGLGLSLSYDIITKGHRGTLNVETQEGEFTEFIVRLPITPTPSRPANTISREMTETSV
ncbi:tetratricopeptide repeat-containing sensor histidine kinase [Hymenobacter fodinae]|uniref:tetratricopeptide repeat-containing sensor histidine kinase n=1 Tax=Hymenobacter fodinae TaxID=2510796 RepID=UPI001436C356|nr:ATP-binding protein [Hymenobacter fodinae]